MKKPLLFLLLFCLLSAGILAQGNLQFNQVINLSSGQSYTVPSGKALKIESMSSINGYVSLPYVGCQQPNGGYYYCVYKGILFGLGGMIDSVSTYNGAGWTSTAGCNCPDPTYQYAATLPAINFPIWIKAGQVVTLFQGSGLFLSGIEFNITQ